MLSLHYYYHCCNIYFLQCLSTGYYITQRWDLICRERIPGVTQGVMCERVQ